MVEESVSAENLSHCTRQPEANAGPALLVKELMHTTSAAMYQQRQLSNMGTLLSGANNNGAHYANGITAMFIACGQGKVYKLAEIVAATVLCGELSLGAAVVADEWVSSHDAYGRNRP